MEQLTSEQISEWEAYDRLDPVGAWREDYRFALLAQVVSNLAISMYGKKGAKLQEITDFIPKWGEDEEEKVKQQSMEEMKAWALSFAKEHNKKYKQMEAVNKVEPKLKTK